MIWQRDGFVKNVQQSAESEHQALREPFVANAQRLLRAGGSQQAQGSAAEAIHASMPLGAVVADSSPSKAIDSWLTGQLHLRQS